MTLTQPPLDQPLYGATFPQAIGRFFRKYATFSGRASRSEYWWAYLFIVGILVILGVGFGVLGTLSQSEAERAANQPGPLGAAFGLPLFVFLLAILVPSIALHVRRLHDVNLPGPLFLITFVPSIGSLVLFVLALMPSIPAGARFDAGAPAAAPPATTPPAVPPAA